MISTHITDLITATKAMPNSLQRNKIMSHLEDAKAHALVLESYSGATYAPGTTAVPGGQVVNGNSSIACSCSVGVRDNDCPIHGNKT